MKYTRRHLIGSLITGTAALTAAQLASADPGAQLPEHATGGYRSGPLGPTQGTQTLASERPTAMIIPAADVDAEVEIQYIVDGQMKDPTGAWVVAWYDGTGMLHEKKRNLLFSGHVDYWGVGPSVFRNLASVPVGSEIEVLGDKGGNALYSVEYVERVTLAQLTPEKMQEITAPTDYEALTIITCGGEFDYNAGEYLQRDVVRARLVSDEGASEEAEVTEPAELAGTPDTTESAVHRAQATVTQDGVNVRAEASTESEAVGVVSVGDVVTLTGEPVEAEGRTWYPIELEDGTAGFIAAEFLQTND